MGHVFINSDSWNLWAIEEPFENYDREGLKRIIRNDVDYYAVPGVEAIFYNSNFQRSFYDTKVGTPYWKDCSIGEDGKIRLRGRPVGEIPGEESPELTYRNMYVRSKAMHEKLPDYMAYRYAYCREKNVEMFHSMRMNDIHHATLGQEWRPQHCDLWLDHKEYVRAWYRHSLRSDWHDNALDYGERKVYDYHLAMAREYLMDYESDGLELDWLRSIPIFRPGFDELNTPLMTRFMRDVKAIAAEAQAKWGHRIRIAARVPGYVKDAVGCSMDVATWAKEGLVDIIIPSCTNTATEQDYDIGLWRAIAPGVVVTPDIDWSMTSKGGWSITHTRETDAGFASNFYQQGADGIYFYNHFSPRAARKPFVKEFFTTASDPEALSRLPRRHVYTAHDPCGEGKLPQIAYPWIWAGCTNGGLKINVGQGTEGRTGKVIVGATAPIDIDIRVNTAPCRMLPLDTPLPELPARMDAEAFYRCAEVPAGVLHDGWNVAEIFNRGTSDITPDMLMWLEISVD